MTAAFSELGLSPAALQAVNKLGYTEPTPIQEQAIPPILKGRDVCAAAATGTGKTAAFLLSTMSTLTHAVRNKQKVTGPRMLVVTPTRELAEQIGSVCRTISNETDHFVATLFGGTKYGPQMNKLRKGVDIIIATPGRLLDLRERGVVELQDIDVLVIDEADRMLDMGFWPDMETIIAQTPKGRQTLLFSATLDRKVMKSVAPILRDPFMVEVAHRGETAATVDQYIIPVESKKKPEMLNALLSEQAFTRVIVFTRTKKRAEEVKDLLRASGYTADSIHSDKPQAKRKRALEKFTKGKTHLLVATDVLARGIDVPSVDFVVNYDLPDMAEDYVHRIGRTGRAGETGFAVSFATRETRSALRDIERLIDREIPYMELRSVTIDPSILETKNKNKHGKKKRVRERDIERIRAHKQKGAEGQQTDAEQASSKSFHGLQGYRSRNADTAKDQKSRAAKGPNQAAHGEGANFENHRAASAQGMRNGNATRSDRSRARSLNGNGSNSGEYRGRKGQFAGRNKLSDRDRRFSGNKRDARETNREMNDDMLQTRSERHRSKQHARNTYDRKGSNNRALNRRNSRAKH